MFITAKWQIRKWWYLVSSKICTVLLNSAWLRNFEKEVLVRLHCTVSHGITCRNSYLPINSCIFDFVFRRDLQSPVTHTVYFINCCHYLHLTMSHDLLSNQNCYSLTVHYLLFFECWHPNKIEQTVKRTIFTYSYQYLITKWLLIW